MEKYKEEQECIDKGYKFLGWQVYSGNCEELKKCEELEHYGTREEQEKDAWGSWKVSGVKIHSKQHTRTGSNCTYWCDECKHYWKIDMSD